MSLKPPTRVAARITDTPIPGLVEACFRKRKEPGGVGQSASVQAELGVKAEQRITLHLWVMAASR